MNQNLPSELPACLVCSRDVALKESLYASIDDSRSWLITQPSVAGDFPSASNIKQMLSEGCDFASVVLDCVVRKRVAPAYANLRCLLERMRYVLFFVCTEDAKWEYQSMARQQETLDRKMGRGSPEDLKWVKQRLESIRHWNRQPEEDGKPVSMRRHSTYKPNLGEMPPNIQEWYEFCSLYVHPTYMGEQNIGRTLADEEADSLISLSHRLLCTISFVARGFEEAIRDE